MSALKRSNQLLSGTVQDVVKVKRQVIVCVNALAAKQQEMVGKMNELAQHQKVNELDIWMIMKELQGHQQLIEQNTDALRLSLQLDLVEQSIDEYQKVLGQMQAVRVAKLVSHVL